MLGISEKNVHFAGSSLLNPERKQYAFLYENFNNYSLIENNMVFSDKTLAIYSLTDLKMIDKKKTNTNESKIDSFKKVYNYIIYNNKLYNASGNSTTAQ